MQDEVGQPLVIDELTLIPKCSIGYAYYPGDGESMDALMKVADERMYAAKRSRKEAASSRP